MAVVQNTFSETFVAGFPGQVANGETSNRLSRTVEDAAGIAFGKAAFRGTGDHGVTATPSATAGAFMGITIADHGIMPLPGGAAADIYPQYSTAGLLDLGNVCVIAGSNTTDGAPVYVTPGFAFTATAGGNTAIPAVFDQTVSSGAPVWLRVRKA